MKVCSVKTERWKCVFLRLRKTVILCLLFILFSCRQDADVPPVLVSDPVCMLTSATGSFQHAGLSFECHNTGSRQISTIDVSFVVFRDETGGNPFYGSNVVSARIAADLAPGTSAVYEVSLDSRLARIPAVPFVIDCFYVTEITFADGSDWSDPLGIFHAGSLMP